MIICKFESLRVNVTFVLHYDFQEKKQSDPYIIRLRVIGFSRITRNQVDNLK